MATTRETMYEELSKYKEMVVDQSRGVTVGDLIFASAQDFWSTGYFPLSTFTLAANSEVQLFSKNIGETGQGSALALTVASTNNVNGDRMPSNQVYIGLGIGFQIFQVAAAAGVVTNLQPYMFTNPTGLQSVAQNTVWSLNVGDGIKRFIAPIDHYPAGCGVWSGGVDLNNAGLAAAAGVYGGTGGRYAGVHNGAPFAEELRNLPLPVIFPPNIKTDIRLLTGAALVLTAEDVVSGYAVAVKATFRGYMMTLPA